MSETPEQEEARCLNCGTAASARYCPSCGQETRVRRVSFLRLAREALSSFLELDSTVLRSIVPLLFRPGYLTRAYVDGHRASQLAPARLYLFLSLIFFLFFHIPTPDADGVIINLDGEVLNGGAEEGEAEAGKQFRLDLPETLPSTAFGQLLAARFASQEERFRGMEPQDLLELFVRTTNSALPKALILFVPVVALLLKVLYVGTGWLYFDHFVFSLHLQSALLLFLLLGLPLVEWTSHGWILPVGVATLGPIYLMLALRKTYQDNFSSLVLRTALFLTGYVGALACFLLLIVFYVTLTA